MKDNLTSQFNIDDEILFAGSNPFNLSETPSTPGRIVAVKFTKASVYYDIVSDVTGDLHKGIVFTNVAPKP